MIKNLFNKVRAFSSIEITVIVIIFALIITVFATNSHNKNDSLIYKAQYTKTFKDLVKVSQITLAYDLKGTNSFGIMPIQQTRDIFAKRLKTKNTWEGADNNSVWANTLPGVLAQLRGNNADISHLSGMILNNGVEIAFLSVTDAGGETTLANDLGNISPEGLIGVILLDLNATDGPNVRNQDQFAIPFYFDGIRDNDDK